MARAGRWAATALLAACLAAIAVAAIGWRALHAPLDVPPDGAWLDVPAGTPLVRVADDLAARGILDHPRWFAAYARLIGDATRIHAGEYHLPPGLTPLSLLEELVAGRVHLHQLTVVEGWRFAELLRAVRQHPAIVATAREGSEIMAALGKPGLHPEGQFLPDTYRFPRGTTEIEFLRQAHTALERVLATTWENRQVRTIAIETEYEALILASIIEKETALASERRRISGVFHRRLRRGMRLQTDPTVIYGLGVSFDGNLRRSDLARDTPYNTYTRAGLPPTPIALPGSASIAAAVDPEIGDALYFVATGLPDGSHRFSATLEEHNEAVQAYLRTLRSRQE